MAEVQLPDVLNISNEQEAIDLIKKALDGEYDESIFQIKFNDWPKLDVTFRGDRYSSSLPSGVMASFLELQSSLNRIYADLVYSGDLRSLSSEDKQTIELVFYVEEGSSKIKADFTGFLNRLGDAMQDSKNFKTVVILVGVLGTAGVGGLVADSYFDNQAKIDIAKIESEALAERDSAETKRLKIVTDAMKAHPRLISSVEKINDAKKSVVASAYDADEVVIDGKHFSKDEIASLVTSQRSTTRVFVLNGTFIIDGLRGYSENEGKSTTVTLKDVESGEVFTAYFDKTDVDSFSFADIDRLFDAFKKSKQIKLSISQRVKPNGDVTKSTIITVKEVVETPEEE